MLSQLPGRRSKTLRYKGSSRSTVRLDQEMTFESSLNSHLHQSTSPIFQRCVDYSGDKWRKKSRSIIRKRTEASNYSWAAEMWSWNYDWFFINCSEWWFCFMESRNVQHLKIELISTSSYGDRKHRVEKSKSPERRLLELLCTWMQTLYK